MIFYNSGYTGGDESNVYGCIRNDISVVDEEYFDLSCNTNTSSSFGRDKHVIINYIINHGQDENGNLLFNVSDRTKLAVMNDEELINKAVELGILKINEYTKPKLVNKYRDY